MILECKNCKKNLTFIEDDINLEGQLITCKYCKENWTYNSMTLYLENKLSELDLDLNNQEIKIRFFLQFLHSNIIIKNLTC